jgi:diadenosine tetraphosphate (Ap4A) HIT family hydrolase
MSLILTSQTKIIIWQDADIIITTPSIPHISKTDGGHLIVSPTKSVSSITELDDKSLLKMMKIVGYCEKALIQVLGEQGIEIPFTNNQDNGNWAVFKNLPKSLHIHIYGRAKNSTRQVFGQAIYAPDPHSTFYDNNVPLSQEDIEQIKKLIITLAI